MPTYTDRIRLRRERAGRAPTPRPLWFVLLVCAALLSGLFVAVILVAGSRTSQVVAAVLVLISTVLFVGYLVIREQKLYRSLFRQALSDAASYLEALRRVDEASQQPGLVRPELQSIKFLPRQPEQDRPEQPKQAP